MKDRIIFMGTPDFASFILERLVEQKVNIIGVVTQPDKAVGRKKQIVFSPVKQVALNNDILVLQPQKIRTDYQMVLDLKPDLIITAAYGQIVPKELLDGPKCGCINVHGSLLPKYRGGAPIHYSILNGDQYTGVTIMEMVEKMDAGNIISQAKFPIGRADNLDIVYKNMQNCGADLLLKTLPMLLDKSYKSIVQDEEQVTYAYNIRREDEIIDFAKSAESIYNKVRAFNSWPVAYFRFAQKNYKLFQTRTELGFEQAKVGEIVRVDKTGIYIKTGTAVIVLEELQPEGKKRIAVKDYLNGNHPFEVGKIIEEVK